MKNIYPIVMLSTDKSKLVLTDKKLRVTPFEGNAYDAKHLYIVSNKEIKVGDFGIAKCNNKDLNEVPFKYIGEKHDGIDLIFIDIEGEKIVTTVNLLKDAKKILASSNNALSLPKIHESFLETYAKVYNDGDIITEVELDIKLGLAIINKLDGNLFRIHESDENGFPRK